ncbi:MAG: hypothetical protein D6692_08850 [Planctomycetota bacterium]|nr:MAG: hypothetical protein D6692_08850 [Planctomycetota bacterium]
MWRLFARVIPPDLPLTPENRKRAVEEGRALFRERGQNTVLWIAFSLIVFQAVLWLIATGVQSFGWPRWTVAAIFWPFACAAFVFFVLIRLRLGVRRAIFEAIIRRGLEICPRCGYPTVAGGEPGLCSECGASVRAERWDIITLNTLERLRFRHIVSDQPLPFEVRVRIMRRAWHTVRASRLGFVMYLLVGLMFLGSLIAFEWGLLVAGIALTSAVLSFVLLDRWCVRPAVQAAQHWVLANPEPGERPA